MSVVIPLFVFYGCATNIINIKESINQNPKTGFYINKVPFFPQKRYYCGPAALASIMNFYGVSISEEETASAVYNPNLNGTLPIDILIFARTKGFDAVYSQKNLEEIKNEISTGKPVILFLDLGYFFYPVKHYIVATGYNDEKGYLVVHSGIEKDKIFSYKEINKAWEKTGFGTILINPRR